METKTVKVPNVGCNGCVNTIKSEVSELAGVLKVEGNPETQLVTIQWDNPADWDAIRGKMAEIDYAPEEA
ncbi:heavy-metal-associated domain-containing protein [Phototrophicus methaneseepsis]|uniref:Heavy-metal-associated domain-containing protein n=1 Tax=Phototrophicus methaneseepsis TaxID=2710758 RepID=A0A7S8E5Q8_9CHLR|nr:heavy-metal-associated domain-containing protein [Phototrophicus methaneseepsis]QPC80840.1 heavy-metal-associated domain-containing protein [Phototrophicus methaneseepsis]